MADSAEESFLLKVEIKLPTTQEFNLMGRSFVTIKVKPSFTIRETVLEVCRKIKFPIENVDDTFRLYQPKVKASHALSSTTPMGEIGFDPLETLQLCQGDVVVSPVGPAEGQAQESLPDVKRPMRRGTRKAGFGFNFKTTKTMRRSRKGTRLFGVPLKDTCPKGAFVPAMLEQMINHLSTRSWGDTFPFGEEMLDTSNAHVLELKTSIEMDMPVALEKYSLQVVCSIVFLFFKNLPEPLLTWKYYSQFVELKNDTYALNNLLDKLPKENKLVTIKLLEFLKQLVFGGADPTKLAQVFGSVILSKNKDSPKDTFNGTTIMRSFLIAKSLTSLTGFEYNPDVHADVPFDLLLGGEQIAYAVASANYIGDEIRAKLPPLGTLYISNYRILYVYKAKDRDNRTLSIPLTSIWKVSHISNSKTPKSTLKLLCKDFRVLQFQFPLKKYREYDLRDLLVKRALPGNLFSTFAFSYEEDSISLQEHKMSSFRYDEELTRLKILGGDSWRACTINAVGSMCVTMPSVFAVPKDLSDESVERASVLREKSRLASPVWKSPISGALLIRCGNPVDGGGDPSGSSKVSGRQEGAWEELMKKTRKSWSPVIDAAQKATGSDTMHHYRFSDDLSRADRLELPTCASLEASFESLFRMCTETAPQLWDKKLEESGWIDALKRICDVAVRIAAQLGSGENVCLSSDDGIDLEYVVSSVVQLMSDPYYRTLPGYRTLVEKEWVSMGYDFGSRHVPSGPESHRQPDIAFLLFVDISWQLWVQHPSAFAFTDAFLKFLMDSVVNCRFGTFLCRGDHDRASILSKTISFWDYVNTRGNLYDNHCFEAAPATTETGGWCIPSNHLILWHDYYLRYCCVPGLFRAFARISRNAKAVTLHLTRLNLCGIPDALLHCAELQRLDLQKNFLNWLNPKLGMLHHLQHINLDDNFIKYIDSGVMRITSHCWPQLESFSAQNNKLVSVEGLPLLNSILTLRMVNLCSNELDSLPPKFGELAQLDELWLGENNFSSFPLPVLSLTNLTALDLVGNEISECPSLAPLESLTLLNLSNNKLTRFPPDVTKLEKLSVLDLSGNDISEVPVTLVSMHSLRRLELAKNNIATLPLTIGKMVNLERLSLDENYNLTTPPLDMATKRPLREVLIFLQELLAGSTPAYRVKAVMVGQEGIGRSAIVRAITKASISGGDAKKPPEDGDITIQDWRVRVSLPSVGKQEITVSLWNFVGSMHNATHQLFLSERAVYLVAWSLALGEEKSRLSFWLESLKERLSVNVPIILIGTHLDKVKSESANAQMREIKEKFCDSGRFPNIVRIQAVSATTGKGIGELRTALKEVVVTLDCVCAQLPKSFTLLEQELTALRSKRVPPIIAAEELSTIASSCGIKGETSVQTYGEMMDSYGTIVQHPEFKDFSVLEPTWLSRAYVLIAQARDEHCTQGILQHSALAEIWREPEYPVHVHNSLLRLLSKCQVVLNLSVKRFTRQMDVSSMGESLVPCLLPMDKPDIDEAWPSFVKDVEQLSRYYRLDTKSYHFFNHVVVRILYYASECEALWSYGIMGMWQEQRFLLELLPLQQVLTLTVRGDNPSRVYRILVDIVDYFINDWFRIEAKITIPCPHCHSIHSFEPFMFSMDDCVQAAMQGEMSVKCFHIRSIGLGLVAPELAMTEVSKIAHSDIDIGEKIGEGGYASVYRGVWKGKEVAVKQLIQPEEESPLSPDDPFYEPGPDLGVRAFEEFRREVWIMSSLCHPNVVGFEGLVMEPYCIISEFLSCGNLYDFLHSDAEASWALRMRIALDLAQALKYLHFGVTPPVIHRDVKSPNVLLASLDPVEDAVVAKMADFGTSSRAPYLTGRMVDNPVWLAPEILHGKVYTERADVYSVGVIMWELATRESFFGQCSFLSQIEDNVMNGIRPNIPEECDERFASMIRRCWAQDPDDRPDMVELVEELEQACLDKGYLTQEQKDTRHQMMEEAERLAETSSMLAFLDAHPPPTHVIEQNHQGDGSPSSSGGLGGGLGGGGGGVGVAAAAEPGSGEAGGDGVGGVGDAGGGSGGVGGGSVGGDPEEADQHHQKELEEDGGRYIDKCPTDKVEFSIQCMAPVRKQVWAGCSDGSVHIWHARTGKYIGSTKVFEKRVVALECVSQQVWLASIQARAIAIYDAKTHAFVRMIEGFEVMCLANSSRLVWAGCTDGTIKLISTKTYAVKREIKLTTGPVGALARCGDSMWAGTDGVIHVLNVTSFKQENQLEGGHTKMIHCMRTFGNEVWSCSSDKTIVAWKTSTGEMLKRLEGHTSRVFWLMFDGSKVWSCSWDGSIIVWNRKEKTFHREITGHHEDAISCVMRLYDEADGVFYVWSGSWDKTISRWTSFTKRRPKAELEAAGIGRGTSSSLASSVSSISSSSSSSSSSSPMAISKVAQSHIGSHAHSSRTTMFNHPNASSNALYKGVTASSGGVGVGDGDGVGSSGSPTRPPHRGMPLRAAVGRGGVKQKPPVPPKRPPRTLVGSGSVVHSAPNVPTATSASQGGSTGVLGVPFNPSIRRGGGGAQDTAGRGQGSPPPRPNRPGRSHTMHTKNVRHEAPSMSVRRGSGGPMPMHRGGRGGRFMGRRGRGRRGRGAAMSSNMSPPVMTRTGEGGDDANHQRPHPTPSIKLMAEGDGAPRVMETSSSITNNDDVHRRHSRGASGTTATSPSEEPCVSSPATASTISGGGGGGGDGARVLDEMLLGYPWFAAHINGAQASALLMGKPAGTFLGRYSAQSGNLTVSYTIDDEGKMGSTRLCVDPSTGEVSEQGTERTWPSIDAFVDAFGATPLDVKRQAGGGGSVGDPNSSSSVAATPGVPILPPLAVPDTLSLPHPNSPMHSPPVEPLPEHMLKALPPLKMPLPSVPPGGDGEG